MHKPRVVLYCNHLLYPSETFIIEQGEAMRSYEPHYFGMRRVRGLSLPEDRTVVLNEGTRQGWMAEALFAFTGISPKLDRKVRELGPSLIHAHFGSDGLRALPLARRAKLPLVVTFHGSDITVKDEYGVKSNRPQRQLVRRRQVLQQNAALFIAVSEFIAAKLVEGGYPPEKVRVHYIGVDTRKFSSPVTQKRERIVLFVGRLHEQKGCKFLIEAMARVQARHPEYKLVLLGDGPIRAELEQLASQKLRNYAFLGVQPPQEVRSWMQRAYVFCAPSLIVESGATEGFGMVFVEAQASGLPVVSFATGGVPEAVAHGKTGFLALERDSEKLAEYVTALIENQHVWNEFSRAGQFRVRQLFDVEKQTSELEALYCAIAEQHGRMKQCV